MSATTSTQLQQLYIAYFGRPADPGGMDYWLQNGITERGFAEMIFYQNEYQHVYGDLSVSDQVNQLYQNLFNRNADSDGLNYWVDTIKSGKLTLANLAIDLVWATLNPLKNNSFQASEDRSILQNKVDASVQFTNKIRSTISPNPVYIPTSQDPWIDGALFEAVKLTLKEPINVTCAVPAVAIWEPSFHHCDPFSRIYMEFPELLKDNPAEILPHPFYQSLTEDVVYDDLYFTSSLPALKLTNFDLPDIHGNNSQVYGLTEQHNQLIDTLLPTNDII